MQTPRTNLAKFLEQKNKKIVEFRPLIFNLAKSRDQQTLQELFARKTIQYVIDDYQEQLREYFQVQNPTRVFSLDFEKRFYDYLKTIEKKGSLWQQGRWVYFPWISTLVHILEDKKFQLVRTARNRNLITQDEQKKIYNAVIGIAGLSVGNSAALAIVLQGGGRHMRLADHDQLALSNLNRICAGVDSLGRKKTEMTARQIYALNPYAKLDLFPDGLTEKNIKKFFEGPPKLDVIVDEVDNLAIKYRIREYARKNQIPVVMGTDNGDNAVIDIERYDKNPNTPFFHGRMGETSYEKLVGLTKMEIGRLIAKYVDQENTTIRMQESLLEIGKTIVSWPQLGNAALLNSVVLAYCIRRILNNQPLEENRALINLDKCLIPDYNSPQEAKQRRGATEKYVKLFGPWSQRFNATG